jgi:hypothetical protein
MQFQVFEILFLNFICTDNETSNKVNNETKLVNTSVENRLTFQLSTKGIFLGSTYK